jgi:hypothetical protein
LRPEIHRTEQEWLFVMFLLPVAGERIVSFAALFKPKAERCGQPPRKGFL